MQDLGYLPQGENNASAAFGINDNGIVVGQSAAPGGSRAFVWMNVGGIKDLNNLLDSSAAGWTLHAATAINNAGQIVGYGTTPGGATHAFLLTPVPPSPLLAFSEFDEAPLAASTFTPRPSDVELGFSTTASSSGGLNPLAGVAASID
jgi:probable HAF family extracellular repeat protein